jgi:NAD-dependent deacetylase
MNAKMMIVGGTSLNVYPAAGLINDYEGHDLVLINRDATPYDSYADIVIHDSLGKVFGELMERLESEEK